jgi:hypothetical protein
VTARREGRARRARGATNPRRGLTARALSAEGRDNIRLLITALLTESGINVSDISHRGDHDELVLALLPGWRAREGRARVFYRSVLKRDATDLDRLARQTALSEVLLFEVADATPARFTVPATVQYISTPELIERLEDSAAVQWEGARPAADRTLLAMLRAVDCAEPWADRLAIRALPVVARNKTPAGWGSPSEPPDELFERLTFRLLTHVFRWSGTDLGATARAEREPDALLESPGGSTAPFSAVLDCKASRDGWSMGADDETRFINYVTRHRNELEHSDDPFLIIVSSAFATGAAAFENRQRTIADACGARLVYVRASQLTASALSVELTRTSPAERELLLWEQYLAEGRPGAGVETLVTGGAL